jgi:hypothetical protein
MSCKTHMYEPLDLTAFLVGKLASSYSYMPMPLLDAPEGLQGTSIRGIYYREHLQNYRALSV